MRARAIALLTVFSFVLLQAGAQTAHIPFNPDQVNYVTPQQLDALFSSCADVLNKKEPQQMTDDEHRAIIRCHNTMGMQNGAQPDGYNYSGPAATRFATAYNNANYAKKMRPLFKYILSRGMGYFFPHLAVELDGTPHLASRYIVRDK